MDVLDPDTPLGELITAHPELAAQLDEMDVDYCAMGARTLAMVCADRGLDPTTTVRRLAARLVEHPSPGWADLPAPELCRHLVETHHADLRRELPALTRRLDELAARHGGEVDWLADAASCARSLWAAGEAHLDYEERVVFPAIAELAAGRLPELHCRTLAGQFSVTRRDHEHLFELIDLLRRVVRNARHLGGAEDLLADVAAAVDRLEADTHLHVHKENNVLAPAVAELEAALRQRGRSGSPAGRQGLT